MDFVLTSLLAVAAMQTLMLACILLVLVAIRSDKTIAVQDAARQAPPADATLVELLHGGPGRWAHHSFRPAGHRDIEEALATPGLAIRRGGRIEEGSQ